MRLLSQNSSAYSRDGPGLDDNVCNVLNSLDMSALHHTLKASAPNAVSGFMFGVTAI